MCVRVEEERVEGSSLPTVWTTAFKANAKWHGRYDYHGQSVQFTLDVREASDDVVKATLQDRITQLELTGV